MGPLPLPTLLRDAPVLAALVAHPRHAARHGLLAALVDAGLITDRSPAIRAEVRAVVAQAERQRRALGQALRSLAAAQIDVVPLKGYALANRLYPAPLTRPSTDVDLLVRPDAVAAASVVLARLGYRRVADPAVADAEGEHHHFAFVGPSTLELHFALSSGFGGATIPSVDAWRRARPAAVDGVACLQLSPEDELVYLAAHAAAHGFLRLGWLFDLHLLTAQAPLRWAAVADVAQRAELDVAVTAALVATTACFGGALDGARGVGLLSGGPRGWALEALLTTRRLLDGTWARTPWAQLLRLGLVSSGARALGELRRGAGRVARRAAAGGLRVGLG